MAYLAPARKIFKNYLHRGEHLSIGRGVHQLPEGETRVKDSLFPCEGAEPRANNGGLTLRYEG